MKIEVLKIADLKPYSKNARTHSKAQVALLVENIIEFGFTTPLLIDSENSVIAGHGRLLAMGVLKKNSVPCVRMDNLTKKQVKALRLADNKITEMSGWDMDMVIEELKELDIEMVKLTGFNTDLLAEVEDKDDQVPALQGKPISRLGEIYELGDHRIMCGDSTDPEFVQKLMADEQANMVWTDPPYNVDYEGGTGLKIENDNMSDDKFYKFLFDFYKETLEIMKKGAPIYVAHADSEGVNFRKALQDAGVKVRQCIIWVKSSLVLGRQDYQWQHEPILYGWKEGAGHFWYGMFDKTTVIDEKLDLKKLKKEELLEILTNLRNEIQTTVIHHDKPSRSSEHPTMKPVGLIVKFIQNSSVRGDIVYDGFGGSGSTLIACEKLERKCYMMELDPGYIDVIIKRWEQFTGEKAVKLN